MPFDIPLDSSAIYLLARGLQANGRITVIPHQTTTSNVITVDIAAEYRDWDLFRSTTVCLLERRRGERGVGVFVSTSSQSPDTGYILTFDKKDTKTPGLDEQEDKCRNHSQNPPSTWWPGPRTPRVRSCRSGVPGHPSEHGGIRELP